MAAVDSFLRNPEHPTPSFAFEPPIYPAVAAAQKIVAQQGGNPNDPAQVVPVAINQHVIQMCNIWLRPILLTTWSKTTSF